jgi:Uma2 family endonuclease
MNPAPTRFMTAAEFWQSQDAGARQELVRGEIVETTRPGGQHGVIVGTLAALLACWVKQGSGGYAGIGAGYILARNPDTVRGPDVSYIRPERIPATGVPEGFWELAPDLVVEIVSPSETADEVREKVRNYLAAGTLQVWTVYPRTREVAVHTPGGLSRTYGEDATLSFPDFLPGFECTVAELFE